MLPIIPGPKNSAEGLEIQVITGKLHPAQKAGIRALLQAKTDKGTIRGSDYFLFEYRHFSTIVIIRKGVSIEADFKIKKRYEQNR